MSQKPNRFEQMIVTLIVLDQFIYGYYGATGLEAAASGTPVVMRLNNSQYSPLYKGDTMPACSAESVNEAGIRILELFSDTKKLSAKGDAMRDWVVRNHSEERVMPLLTNILAQNGPCHKPIRNPLFRRLRSSEIEWHRKCFSD